jgi:hypothetical protein
VFAEVQSGDLLIARNPETCHLLDDVPHDQRCDDVKAPTECTTVEPAKSKHAQRREEAAAPDPVAGDGIQDAYQKEGEEDEGVELDPLRHGSRASMVAAVPAKTSWKKNFVHSGTPVQLIAA